MFQWLKKLITSSPPKRSVYDTRGIATLDDGDGDAPVSRRCHTAAPIDVGVKQVTTDNEPFGDFAGSDSVKRAAQSIIDRITEGEGNA